MKILGTWHLESFDVDTGDGLAPWGQNMRGILIYADSGYMSVSISKDQAAPSDNEAEDILDSLLFYAGLYRIEGDTIIHSVTIASAPDRVGHDQRRRIHLRDDALTLETFPDAAIQARLCWKRSR